MTEPIGAVVGRILIYLAFIVSGVLCFLAYLMSIEARPPSTNAEPTALYYTAVLLGVCFSPIWLISAVLSGIFAWKLGGAWRILGWIPLLLGVVVIIWALQIDLHFATRPRALARAAGICEQCHKPAQFARKSDGSPYLEAHHVRPLADDGDDTFENVRALCPTCHRRVHYG